jgi:CMP-N-acetylneuraminic acid synthetase
MRGGRSVLAVVPARGGSKGVPLKNLRPVGGVPLVARVGHLVRELPWIDRAVVSTDHAEIARTAREAGLDAPFYRPEALSGDRVGDREVLAHALEATEALDGRRYDVVLMLQPTSPLRRAGHVAAAVDALLAEDLDSVWTVSPTDPKHHPWKQLTVEGGRLALFDPAGAAVVARQELPPVFHRNGAAYAIARPCLLEQRAILGRRAGAVVIEEPMVSIDTEEDFAKVEAVLRARAAEPAAAAAAPAAPAAAPDPSPPAPRTFVVDLDGVVASLVPGNDYARATPLRANVERVNALHGRGHRVVLFTARGGTTGIDWSEVTRRQLEEWGVRYHELRFGKPAGDYYIDDRSVSLEDAVRLTDPGRGGEE